MNIRRYVALRLTPPRGRVTVTPSSDPGTGRPRGCVGAFNWKIELSARERKRSLKRVRRTDFWDFA